MCRLRWHNHSAHAVVVLSSETSLTSTQEVENVMKRLGPVAAVLGARRVAHLDAFAARLVNGRQALVGERQRTAAAAERPERTCKYRRADTCCTDRLWLP